MSAKARYFDAPDAAILRVGTRYDNHRAILIANHAGLRCGVVLFSAGRKLYIRSSLALRLNMCDSSSIRLY